MRGCPPPPRLPWCSRSWSDSSCWADRLHGRTTRPELAIRLALGADPGQIRSLVLASGRRPFVAGLLLGVFGGVMVGVFASSLLYGVGPVEPLSMCAAAALVGVVVLGASHLPARRAMRIDPAGPFRQ